MATPGYELQPATIRIKNLRLRTFIGIKEEEIRNRQDVIINAWIRYDASQAASSDEMSNALNYRTITKAVISLVEENRFHLLEKLCQDVLELVMNHGAVKEASVEIDKPHALRFADSVSMELHAKRGD
ncbi:dihydroneopterin triphosphate 2'-epimerase [Balneatrix alpica]|uniref:Dihydroneopterin triphosphate 2'-epimerase n=1 Tax=Balneatrix alpica TaxID=75684 RepID=A0ABV5Z6H6_9GAMM|nr:dihydroneopterin triphosphate 2'-epimerase [Balneatrix alpica]